MCGDHISCSLGAELWSWLRERNLEAKAGVAMFALVLQDTGLYYHRYLQEVINVLETDGHFREKLQAANAEDIKVRQTWARGGCAQRSFSATAGKMRRNIDVSSLLYYLPAVEPQFTVPQFPICYEVALEFLSASSDWLLLS